MLEANVGLASGSLDKLIIEVVGRDGIPTGSYLEFVDKKGSGTEIQPKHVGKGVVVYELPIVNGKFEFICPGVGPVTWPANSPVYIGCALWQRDIGDCAIELAFSNTLGKDLGTFVFKQGEAKNTDPDADETERKIGPSRQWVVDTTAELT
jgi:hypothetical protein